MSEFLSFLSLNNIPLCVYTTFGYPFIHQLTLRLFPPFSSLNTAAMNIDVQTSVWGWGGCGGTARVAGAVGELYKQPPRAFFWTKSSCSSLPLLTNAQALTQPNFPTGLETIRVKVRHGPTLLSSWGITWLPNFSGNDSAGIHSLRGWTDRTGEHYAKWNKPGSERQIPYDLTFKWNLSDKTNKQEKYNWRHWN